MIPLFKPRPLTGCYLKEVLNSGHLVTGPMVERLREAAARMAHMDPDHVAIGASATACMEAIHVLVQPSALRLEPKATWPLFQGLEGEMPGWEGGEWTLYTDIGGEPNWGRSSLPVDLLAIHDCSHSWAPIAPELRFCFASISPIKLCDGVQGGVVWCEYADEARELQSILNYGFLDGHDKPRDWRTRDPRGWRWNMSDVHAALNLEAIERLDETKARYRDAWEDMAAALGSPRELVLHDKQPYLCQLRVRSVPRAIEFMNKRGVAAGHNFPPASLVTVPAWPGMDRNTIKTVASVAKDMLEAEWNGSGRK